MKQTLGSTSSMSRWVTTFKAAAVLIALLLPDAASSQASREEVLKRIYPSATIQSERQFLTEDQIRRVATISGVEVPTALIARYVAAVGGKVVGRAYVDTHL